MASQTQWTWVWVNPGRWWWTGRPGVLRFMGSQSQTRLSNWNELNRTEVVLPNITPYSSCECTHCSPFLSKFWRTSMAGQILWTCVVLSRILLSCQSKHLILYCILLLLSSVFSSIRVFSSESALCIRWSKYWSFSFSISPSSEYSGLISFRSYTEWDGWMASLNQWMRVWANSRREWTGKPSVLQSQRVEHDLAIEQQQQI